MFDSTDRDRKDIEPETTNNCVLTNYELTLLVDALDELRKSSSVGINEIVAIGMLAEKLGSWVSKIRFGIDLVNVRQSSSPIGISIGDEPNTLRPEKDSLGKK